MVSKCKATERNGLMADKFWRNTYLQLPNTHRAVGPLTKDWSLSTGYICCHPDGRPLRVDDITSHFIDIVKGLGLKDFGFHTLRHTVATQLAMKNIAVAKTRAFMGHKDVATTLRYYTHIPPEASIECAGVMSETVFA